MTALGRSLTGLATAAAQSNPTVSSIAGIHSAEYLIWSALEALHALEGQPIPQEELTALQRRVDRLTKGLIQ